MDTKLIFLDIDGTLTESGSNIPPVSAQEAIRRARANGHKVVLCSGRNYGMLSPLLQYGFDGLVGSAGGYIEYDGEVVYDCPMTSEQQDKVLSVFEESGIYRTVESKTRTYTDEGFQKFLRENAQASGNSELLRWREQLEKDLASALWRSTGGSLSISWFSCAGTGNSSKSPGSFWRVNLTSAFRTPTGLDSSTGSSSTGSLIKALPCGS